VVNIEYIFINLRRTSEILFGADTVDYVVIVCNVCGEYVAFIVGNCRELRPTFRMRIAAILISNAGIQNACSFLVCVQLSGIHKYCVVRERMRVGYRWSRANQYGYVCLGEYTPGVP